MEGELNIWDYDSSKHDIHKAQSSRILDDTIRSPTFNLIKNKTSPKMFMVLTNKNVLVYILSRIINCTLLTCICVDHGC